MEYDGKDNNFHETYMVNKMTESNSFTFKLPWIVKELHETQFDNHRNNLSVEKSRFWRAFYLFIVLFVIFYLLFFLIYRLFY